MPVSPLRVVIAVWTVLLVVWAAGALTAKRTVRRVPYPARVLQLVMGLLAWALITGQGPAIGWLDARFVPDSPISSALGLALTFAGAAFTLWARFTLGSNWSGAVTVKADHELMTRGPYAIVRHPIYSGLLLTMLGTAVVVGKYRGLVCVGLLFTAWKTKSLTEERLMTEQFGEQYLAYKRRVKSLVPFVF
jgi:protein-S-isoprenylcysteine O-methyltransferase Ste14